MCVPSLFSIFSLVCLARMKPKTILFTSGVSGIVHVTCIVASRRKKAHDQSRRPQDGTHTAAQPAIQRSTCKSQSSINSMSSRPTTRASRACGTKAARESTAASPRLSRRTSARSICSRETARECRYQMPCAPAATRSASGRLPRSGFPATTLCSTLFALKGRCPVPRYSTLGLAERRIRR